MSQEATRRSESAKSSNGPADTVRQGNLKITIWRNQGEKGTWYNIDLMRTFRDESGFHDTHSIPAEDLLRVGRLANKAYDKLQELKAADKAHKDPDESFEP